MSRINTRSLALALLVGLGAGASESRGQQIVGNGAPPAWAPPVVIEPAGWGFAGAVAGPFPYSYPAAYPLRARAYVPYGNADAFAFHGDPYGRPYDRWSWSSLSGAASQPARYYYPPVR
jgi:hypothetical protein